MLRYFQAHCVASFGVAIALAVPHGIPPCSDAIDYFLFSPLSAPAFLLVSLFGDIYAWRHPLTILTAYVTYFTIFTLYLLLSRPLHRPNDHLTCPTCRYDLTGNTSGTCPECGSPIPQRAHALHKL